MNFRVALLFSALAVAIASPTGNTKIVGGQDASPGDFKYQVSLRQNKRHFCGGSIISKNRVVTAAHCNMGLNGFTIVAGTNSLTATPYVYTASEIVEHPGWNPSTLENDIAIIKLNEDIEFNDLIQAVKLPTSNVADNSKAMASGWGYTSYPGSAPEILKWLELNIISNDHCKDIQNSVVFDSQICTLNKAGEGVCSGDSGGPLVSNGELHGVTSAAYLCALGLPDFFTRVYSFNSWIATQM